MEEKQELKIRESSYNKVERNPTHIKWKIFIKNQDSLDNWKIILKISKID